jgi:3-methylcrotonyl-CoA carboxylase alpha subunit
MFNKILIANRGEIACRIARSARAMGIRSVAVYSDADRRALHVDTCDEAIHIGGSAPGDSYLLADNIIAAALKTGAEAIHPGFGFLSENADFAERCAASNLVFIGPGAQAIRSMGSKSAARQIMQAAGVPVLPGYDGDEQAQDVLLEQARQVGFPLLIKAVAGGGGKGLRSVERESEFDAALQAVKRESMGAFADDAVLLERFLPTARHIEIQVFADTHGNVVHLFERDCSLQRRHQKVIEEAPAPGIDNGLREDMAAAAVLCAKATDYVGAGTVEFLLAPDKTFYFMEMNTRLQVEHPVTEMITGQDLVAWQFKVAAGESLPLEQSSLAIKGHAIEARIYAENPESNFLPSTGRLDYLQTPQTSANIRIDTGVRQEDEISAYYDPMIAKLICYGDDRAQALARLKMALNQYRLIGPKSNINFLHRLCTHPAVLAGGATTRFIDSSLNELIAVDPPMDENALISAVVFLLQKQAQLILDQQRGTTDPNSPWTASDYWRVGESQTQRLNLQYEHNEIELAIYTHNNGWNIKIQDNTFRVEILASEGSESSLLINDLRYESVVLQSANTLRVLLGNVPHKFTLLDKGTVADNLHQQKDRIVSPMPGKIISCTARAGLHVKKGETLMVLEAMKMEHALQAPHAGEISEVYFSLGEQVNEGETLFVFKE